MNGPTHYREAEELLAKARTAVDTDKATQLATEAQAHATLALAAVTLDIAVKDVAGPLGEEVTDAWASAMDNEPEVPQTGPKRRGVLN